MSMKKTLLALVVLVLSVPAVFAQVDDANETHRLDVSEYSTALKAALNRTDDEWDDSIHYAEQQHKMLEMTIAKNPAELKRLRGLMAKVIQASQKPDLKVTVVLFESDEVNAYANAAKYIYVSTGLLKVVQDDDGMGFILAHELGHLMARSVERRVEFTMKNSDAMAELAVSRQLEHEADVLGLQYAEKAGFAYENILAAMDTLTEEEHHIERMLTREAKSVRDQLKTQTDEEKRKDKEHRLSQVETYLKGLKELEYRSHPTMTFRKNTIKQVHTYLTAKGQRQSLPAGTQYIFTVSNTNANQGGSFFKRILDKAPRGIGQDMMKKAATNLKK